MKKALYYFESHITIEPIFDEVLEKADNIAKKHKFQIADLLMQKRAKDTPERSKYDTFMTGRGVDYEDLCTRTEKCIKELQADGLTVWRYKIEDTLMDSKFHDVFRLGVGK